MNPRSEPQKSFPYPQIARFSLAGNAPAAQFACIVGLRQSLVRSCAEPTMCPVTKGLEFLLPPEANSEISRWHAAMGLPLPVNGIRYRGIA